jgi:hypothetical protein
MEKILVKIKGDLHLGKKDSGSPRKKNFFDSETEESDFEPGDHSEPHASAPVIMKVPH